MRHLGSLEEERLALRFHDYMLARGMPTRVDREGHEWSLWIVEEDHVDAARTELEEFLAAPEDGKYVEAAKAAEHIRRDQAKREKEMRKREERTARQMASSHRHAGVVSTWLVLLSVALTFVSVNWRDPFGGSRRGGLALNDTAVLRATMPVNARPVGQGKWKYPANETLAGNALRGEVWRLVTPIFLHFGPFHLLFNLLWLRQLGGAIELRRGPWRFLGLVLVIAVISNLAQSVMGSPIFGGMSGVVFGLFGYIWMKSRYDPAAGLHAPPNVVFLMIFWLFLCTTGAVGPIANTAHFVGLGVGAAVAMIPVLQRRR